MSTQIRDPNVVSSGAPKLEKHMVSGYIYFCTSFDTEYFPSQDFLSKQHPQFYTSFSLVRPLLNVPKSSSDHVAQGVQMCHWPSPVSKRLAGVTL